uniref:Replication protein A 70 kDa DNA-binding subunit B/D first OB fold domain-containing protein n=1 Tax=Tanacetum cinerariifolium TaxID=118510 RepID=A0A6L2NY31_TANCI|nr:hypothetical protein [Tanacetum cinerariifolium]
MSNKAADNMSNDVEQPTTDLSPDMPNDPVVQSNKDLALNEQPNGAAVESKSNDVQQAKTDLVVVGTSSEPVQKRKELFLDELAEGVNETVVVMVCRSWDVHAVTGRYLSTDFVLSDAKGNAIHCTTKANIAHNFLKLKEGSIYLIRDFVVHPNKDEYRIFRDHAIILGFDGATFVRKTSVKGGGFVRYPFELQDLGNIELTNNKYLIGRTTHQRTSSRTLDFYLTNGSDGEGALNQSSTFNCKVKIDNVRMRKGWNYPSCGGSKCKKGIDQKARSFWCDSCNKLVEYMVLRCPSYLASSPRKCNWDHTHPGTKIHTYYEHDTFESFTCWRIVPEEVVEESAGSSNVDTNVLAKRKRVKTLAMHPSVSTPLKPAEDKKKKRVELEDSKEEMEWCTGKCQGRQCF